TCRPLLRIYVVLYRNPEPPLCGSPGTRPSEPGTAVAQCSSPPAAEEGRASPPGLLSTTWRGGDGRAVLAAASVSTWRCGVPASVAHGNVQPRKAGRIEAIGTIPPGATG